MRGYWKNGPAVAYGGDGLNASTGANLEVPADYMFPDDTDPYQWGTVGIPVEPWTDLKPEPSGRPFVLAERRPLHARAWGLQQHHRWDGLGASHGWRAFRERKAVAFGRRQGAGIV